MIEQVEAKGPTPTTSFHTLSNHDTKATKASTFRGNMKTLCFFKGSLNSQSVRQVCLSFQSRPLPGSELRRSNLLLQQEKLSQRGNKPRIAFKKNQRRHPKTKSSAHVTGNCPVVGEGSCPWWDQFNSLEGSH